MAPPLTVVFNCLPLVILCLASSLVLAEIGCPPPEDITPCICDDRTSPRLTCSSILETSVLESVFKNSARYTFQEVHIRSSAIQYLPRTAFQEVRINELYIENSTLIVLFDGAPATETLQKLQLINTKLQRGFTTYISLKNVTSLKILIVDCAIILDLHSTFNQIFPSSLKRITLRRTGTRLIKSGTFDSYHSLDRLEISDAKLKKLTRDMFPRPFNVRFLYFNNNNISYIPDDLFIDMPELQFLSMRNNYISVVPEAAFGYRRTPIPYLRLDGNPLQCNCLLVWLVKNKPEIIGGTCHSPRNLMGKNLQDLLPGDFNCL